MSNPSHLVRSGLILGAMVSLAMVSGVARAATVPALESVAPIDLNLYKGQWYQIALYPNSFQKQCVSNTTATYTQLPDGSVEVLNQCKTANGSISKAVGNARVKKPKATLANPKPLPASTSRLEVRFAPKWLAWAPAVWAPYWVIQLADDYRYAVVGEPTRKFLWILSRTPTLDPADEAQIMGRLPLQGYDPSKLRMEPQPQ
jgi:apolipoprotein D and lipocalin family protein